MFEFFLLIGGIIGLILGTHVIIKGALNIAEHFKLSKIFIGLTILAVGTDLPELVVHIKGAIVRLSGIETSGLIIGETVGTAMGQIALTLGIIGFIGGQLLLTKRELDREGTMLIGSVALFFLLGIDGELSRYDGGVLIIVYIIYFILLYKTEKKPEKDVKRAPPMKSAWAIISLVSGFILLIYSSNMVVDNAVYLAENSGYNF